SPTLTLHLLGNFGSRISEIKHRINRSSVMTQFEMQHGAVVDSRNHLAALDSIPALDEEPVGIRIGGHPSVWVRNQDQAVKTFQVIASVCDPAGLGCAHLGPRHRRNVDPLLAIMIWTPAESPHNPARRRPAEALLPD
ncbi:MAG: hypothetical protein WBQ45_12170, partial [Roseiarcus sp.]